MAVDHQAGRPRQRPEDPNLPFVGSIAVPVDPYVHVLDVWQQLKPK
jgi:hypothetical protein